MQTKINNIHFSINEEGLVISPQYGSLGTIDDCEAFAETVWTLFESLCPDELN